MRVYHHLDEFLYGSGGEPWHPLLAPPLQAYLQADDIEGASEADLEELELGYEASVRQIFKRTVSARFLDRLKASLRDFPTNKQGFVLRAIEKLSACRVHYTEQDPEELRDFCPHLGIKRKKRNKPCCRCEKRTDCPAPVPKLHRCNHVLCPACAAAKSEAFRKKAAKAVERRSLTEEETAFYTTCVKVDADEKSEALRLLRSNSKLMMASKRFRRSVRGGYWHFEVQPTEDGDWNIHRHYVVEVADRALFESVVAYYESRIEDAGFQGSPDSSTPEKLRDVLAYVSNEKSAHWVGKGDLRFVIHPIFVSWVDFKLFDLRRAKRWSFFGSWRSALRKGPTTDGVDFKLYCIRKGPTTDGPTMQLG